MTKAIRWSPDQLFDHQRKMDRQREKLGKLAENRAGIVTVKAPPKRSKYASQKVEQTAPNKPAGPGAVVTVVLPFPSMKLNPNNAQGRHWASTSGLRKKARGEAAALTRVAATAVGWRGSDHPAGTTVALMITFIQPDRRQRDRDNLLAACKPALDGVADALEINDAQFDPVTIHRAYGRKPGSVTIEIGTAVLNIDIKEI